MTLATDGFRSRRPSTGQRIVRYSVLPDRLLDTATPTIFFARVAEILTGQTILEALRDRVLDPLGLQSTWYAPDEPNAGVAIGGLFVRGGVTDSIAGLPMTALLSHVGPSGGPVSNTADLATFGLCVLRDHEVLGERSAAEPYTIGPGGSGLGVLGVTDPNRYQRQFRIFSDEDVPVADYVGFGGTGQLPGSSTKLVYLTGSDTIFVLLLNMSAPPGGSEFFRWLLSRFLEDIPED